MTVSANATATLPSNNGILTSKIFDALSSPIYSIHAKPTRPQRLRRRLRLMTGPCKVHNSLLTYPCPHAPQLPTRSSSRLLPVVHRGLRLPLIHYLPVTLDWSSLNSHPNLVSSSPAHPLTRT